MQILFCLNLFSFVMKLKKIRKCDTYLIGVRSVLMLRSVAGITKSFATSWILAGVRFLAGMRPEMSLEIFQSRVSFEATLKLHLRKI